MSKSPEMKLFLDILTLDQFGRCRSDMIESASCVTCGGSAEKFRDELSRKEFSISGMCQKCQDSVFGE